jgi:hypothetical protein
MIFSGLAGMVIIVIAVVIIPLIIARLICIASRQKDASRHDPMSICTIGYNVAIAGYGNTATSSTLRIHNQTMSAFPLSLNNLLLTVIRHRQVAPGSTYHGDSRDTRGRLNIGSKRVYVQSIGNRWGGKILTTGNTLGMVSSTGNFLSSRLKTGSRGRMNRPH